MRKTIVLAGALLVGASVIHAEETERYFEGFETATVESSCKVSIPGWGQIQDSYEWEDDYGYYYGVETPYYSVVTGKTGKCLKCGMQSGTTDSYPYESYTLWDYVVTPTLSGKVDFMAMRPGSGTITIKKAVYNAATKKYETTGDALSYEGTLSSTWSQLSLTLTEPTMLAIRLNGASIDDFYADNAEVAETRSMKIEKVSYFLPDAEEGSKYPSSAKVIMDDQNKGKIGARIKVTNTGNVALTPGTEGYSVKLKIASSVTATGSNIYTEVDVPLTFTLQPGESKADVDVSCEFTTTSTRPNLSVFENLNDTYVSIGYFEVVPYIAKLSVKEENGSMSLTSKEIGVYQGEKEIRLKFQNDGGAPLVIEGTNNEAVTFTGELPITVDALSSSVLTLKVSGFDGEFSQRIDVNSNSVETSSTYFTLKGYEVPEGKYFNNFDGEDALEGWVKMNGADNKWTLTHDSKDTKDETQKLVNSTSTVSKIVSPRIHLEAGEKYGFQAYASDRQAARLYVTYSTDRTNWSEDYVIAGSSAGSKDASFNSTAYQLDKFIFTAPATGDYYIGLESKYAAVDNFFGGVVSNAAHDIAVASIEAKGSKVNYPLTVSASFDNYKSTPETDYSVEMRIDGEVAATAEPQEIAFGVPAVFDFSVIPHMTGVHQVTVALVFDDEYQIESAPVEVEILEELENYEHQVNDMTASAAYLPLYISNYASMCDIIVPAERIGLAGEADLTALSLLYYNTMANDYVKTDISIYVANTDEDAIAEDNNTLPDFDAMTLVYRSTNHAAEEEEPDCWEYVSSTNTGMSEYKRLKFNFTEPFHYTGGNLRVFFKHNQKDKSGNSSYTFRTMDKLPNTQVRYKSQYLSTGKDLSQVAFGLSTSQPVMIFDVYEPAATLSGRVFEKVKAANPEARSAEAVAPVPGAVVTLADAENPDIWYTATSDDDGNYTMKVFQPKRNYTLTAEGTEDFDKYAHPSELTFADEPEQTLDVEMTRAEGSGVDEIEAATKAYVTVGSGFILVHGTSADVEVFDLAGARVATGQAGKSISLASGVYVVKAGDLSAKVNVK